MELLERLRWVQSLKVGSDVYVTIATIPTPVRGIIRYIGGLSGEEGRKFGIELMECRGQGTHNGEFKKQKYFKCEKNCAMFVSMDKITGCDAAEAAKVIKTPDSSVSKPQAKNNHSIKADDPVTFYDKYNILYRGVAKWIGMSKSNTVVVGIEVEDNLSMADIPYRINIREDKQLFSSKKSKIFLPITFVQPDTSISNDRHSGDKDTRSHTENVHVPTKAGEVNNPHNLVVGSAVRYLNTEQYGVIKWMETLSSAKTPYAGVEMDDYVDSFGSSDGSWGGIKYFDCKPHRGKFVLLNSLTPDQRIIKEKSTKPPAELNATKSTSPCPFHNPYNLTVGCLVQYGSPAKYGVIKWMGYFPDNQKTVYAGLIMNEMVARGAHDGVWNDTRYYVCEPNRGIFVRLLDIEPFNAGNRKGSADNILLNNTRLSDETNITEHHPIWQPSVPPAQLDQNPHKLEVGSTVQHGEPVEYGVIKWIGVLPGRENVLYAGVEMENIADNYTDGMFESVQYFKSRPGRGKFVKMLTLQPDKRFIDNTTSQQVFEVGSKVQFGRAKEHGVVKWIGNVPGSDEEKQYVKVETEGRIESELIPLCQISAHVDNSSLINEGESNKPKMSETVQAKPISAMLEVGSVVQFGDPVQYGVIKRIEEDPISNKEIAIVETEKHEQLKLPLDEIKPDSRFNSVSNTKDSVKITKSDDASHVLPHPVQQVLEVGSMAQFGNPAQYGVIKLIRKDPYSNEKFAEIETEDGGYKAMPLVELQPDVRFVSNAQHPQEEISNSHAQYNSSKLETGSLIQFGNPVQYGVIKRIETTVAEVETEYNQLKKIPLAELQPDNRFIVDVNKIDGQLNPLEKEFYTHEETLFPVPPADKFDAVKHTDIKGIQGYQNSCYLDATLYGMFTFSDAFDILILEDITTNAEELHLQKRLKYEIVYPLRKKGIVIQSSIKGFREHLAEVQNMKGLTSEEKDPEEFLNLLFKHVLHLDPFITIRRPSGIDKEFFVQLFVEPDKDEPTMDTQRLLSKMFQEQNITFVEYPTRLLLQMPRYGKRFKSFQRIIPSLELNVTPLCMTPGLCCICQRRMGYVCNDCSHQKNQMQFYCSTCSPRWHQSYCDHIHELYNNDFDTGTLQLLSVLCIETSHYVCFTRITGSGKDEWVFFDSMAERQDNGYNLPKVTHCTPLLQEFVYGEKDIGNISSKNLPELVRRFVEDAYLCIYIDYDGVMYQ